MAEPPRLLGPHELAELGPPEAVRLPIDLVDPNPRNPRRDLAEIPALAESIKDFSLLQPVTVRRVGERYELIGGHRRWAAFLLLAEQEPNDPAWRTIPAVVRTMDEDRGRLALITSQVHNRAWTTREEAAILEELASTQTLREVGAQVHKSEGWVSKRLRVYADAVLSGYVQTGKLSTSIAEELLLVKDPAQRREFAERAIAESWSWGEARTEVRRLTLDKQLREVAKRARELLMILGTVDAGNLSPSAKKDLVSLSRRIRVLAMGEERRFPTIEAAQRAARVNPNAKPRREKKKRRAMPRPA